MRVLKDGEKPKVGSEVEIIYTGEVVSVSDSGTFRVQVDNVGPSAFFWKNRSTVIREIKPAPRTFIDGAMYVHGLVLPSFYLRQGNGWRSAMTGEYFRDSSPHLSSTFLAELKLMRAVEEE